MTCSLYHFPLRVAFQGDIPSHWRECWSANGHKINARVIHIHMGSVLRILEDRKWETVRSWWWITKRRLNKDEDTGNPFKFWPFKTFADLYCILQWLWKRSLWVSSISKSRWCKRTRVLSKWSPADCWPLCLFPSIMPSSGCACVCFGSERCLFACHSVHFVARVQVRLWRICLCHCVAWMSNLSCSYSAKHSQPWPQPSPWWRERRESLNQLTLFWQWKVLMLRILFLCFLPSVAISVTVVKVSPGKDQNVKRAESTAIHTKHNKAALMLKLQYNKIIIFACTYMRR